MNAAVQPGQQVLLIGDGDFSSHLALSKYLPPSCIFGTNLETNVSIQKHKNAEDNMKELIDKGKRLRILCRKNFHIFFFKNSGGPLCDVIINKLEKPAIVSEFDSHCMPPYFSHIITIYNTICMCAQTG